MPSDDRVVVRQIVDGRDRRRLVELEAGLPRDLLGHELGHALDVDRGAGFARAFGHGLRHLFDMAVA